MPQNDDYAIVVGITKYPGLGAPPNPSADLQASEKDALLIKDWLMSKSGGDLPEKNVHSILTSDFQNIIGPHPQAVRIRDEFTWLYNLAEKNFKAGNGLQVGRRLYIYMAGHGFSPKRGQGALYTANATTFDPLHSYASGWLEWFQDNAYFKEYVLWMDCCMDRDFSVPTEPTFRSTGSMQPAGPTFIGLAARRPLKTVERAIAEAKDGGIHGVFTWTLLQGLKYAVDPVTRQVNGRSLGDYLINGVKRYLNPDDSTNPDVSKEPEINGDINIIFADKQNPLQPRTTLRLPPSCENEEALVWSGSPPQPAKWKVTSGVVFANLGLGLHLIEVPSRNVRQGFEVGGGEPVEIQVPLSSGVPAGASLSVQNPPPGTMFSLAVWPGNPAAEVFVINQKLQLEKQGKNTLSETLPFGLYKVKLRIGRDSDEVIVLLDRNVAFHAATLPAGEQVLQELALGLRLKRPQLASAAPLDGNSLTHEYQVAAAESWMEPAIRPPALFGTSTQPASAEIRVMARVWSRTGISPGAEPWKGVELTRADGQTIVKLADRPIEFPQSDPFVKARVDLLPANYFLRQRRRDGREFEQSLIVPKGWALEVFLLSVSAPTGHPDPAAANAQCPALDRCTIRMRSLTQNSTFPDMEQILETARIALVDERNVLNSQLEELLFHKFENPLAGVLGAHLLIMEADRNPANAANRLAILNEVVPNLRLLMGTGHPDVEAISLRCPSQDLRATTPFQLIPMFERSWRLMVEASADQPDIVPEGLWQRVHAMVKMGGYLVWARDSVSQESYLKHLNAWVTTMAGEHNPPVEPLEVALDSTSRSMSFRGGLASAPTAPTLEAASPDAAIPQNLLRRLGVPASALQALLWNPKGKSD